MLDSLRNTCGNYWDNDSIACGVGLFGHDETDADYFFNEIGFDFIKVDFCGGDPAQNSDHLDLDERERYTAISEAIKKTGRDDVKLNVCRWDYPGTWVSDVASSWRISHDIAPNWNSVKDIIYQNMNLSAYCRDGKFNDMDMLEVGRGMSEQEDMTHFGMWCIMASPLLIGCDMAAASESTIALLSNPELIAVNQDSLCVQAYPVGYANGCHVLVKDVVERRGLERVVAVYNPTDMEREVSVRFGELELSGSVDVRDLFDRQDVGVYSDSMTMSIPAHGAMIYGIKGEERTPRVRYEAEAAFITDYQELCNNQAVLTGTYEYDSSCSSGAKATWLGGRSTNDLIWDDVYAECGGRYRITICGVTGEDRDVAIDVNGIPAGVVTFSPGRTEKSMVVSLNAGKNVVRLHNDSARMPDIDYMELLIDKYMIHSD